MRTELIVYGVMKTFNVNTDQLIVKFPCPQCDCIIEQDCSDIIPTPIWTEEHASDSENCDSVDVECSECGQQFTIEVYMNIYEGNVRITYFDENGNEHEIDDDDIELEEYVSDGNDGFEEE